MIISFFGIKQFKDTKSLISVLRTFDKIYTKPTNSEHRVAMAIPDTPIAGIGPNPYINKGLSKIFKKNPNIKTFL